MLSYGMCSEYTDLSELLLLSFCGFYKFSKNKFKHRDCVSFYNRRNSGVTVQPAELLRHPSMKAMPVLSFPGGRLIGVSVEELVKDGHLQAMCMKSIAEKYPGWELL